MTKNEIVIKKTDNTIVNKRVTEDTEFDLTNSKGETRTIIVREYYDSGSEYEMAESEETIYHKLGTSDFEITDWEQWVIDMFGEEVDADTLIDDIREQCNN